MIRHRAPSIRVGLLGAGYIADWHASALRSVPGATLVAVCDRDRVRAAELAARHGAGGVYDSIGAMIDAGGLDVVHVLLPPDHHSDAAMQLAAAGLHVVIEKPMCIDPEQCAALASEAHRRDVRLGVGHNFLFAEPYERLRADLRAGRIGRPDRIVINWRKPLDILRDGPFDLWMLRDPAHIMLEIGPHSVSQMLDLVGPVELVDVRVSAPVDLPGGVRFYRRWQVDADAGPTRVTLEFGFGPGFAEQVTQVRGALASAVADFERNTYVLSRHSPSMPDLDRYRMAADEARDLGRQARRNLSRFALATLKLARDGKPYGASIARTLRSFYASLPGEPDSRLGPELGSEVVRLCQEIGRHAPRLAPRPGVPPVPAADPAPDGADVLIVGATGFIGRELTRQLLDADRGVRALIRTPGRLPEDLRGRPGLEVVRGDASDPKTFDRALQGVDRVVYLAVAHGKTWADYVRNDVEVTRRVAESCLRCGVGRLVYTGTIDSYYNGPGAGTITEETPIDPHIGRRNKYARAKAAAEAILLQMHRDRGLPVVIARPAIVVGRGGSPFHVGVARWSYGSVCEFWGDGTNPLPLVLVEDVAAALALALDAPGIDGQTFNLAAEASISARDYADELQKALGAEFRTIPTPSWRPYLGEMAKWAVKQAVRHPERSLPSRRDWASRQQRATYDCSRARRVLGWRPTDDRDELIRRGIHAPATEWLGMTSTSAEVADAPGPEEVIAR